MASTGLPVAAGYEFVCLIDRSIHVDHPWQREALASHQVFPPSAFLEDKPKKHREALGVGGVEVTMVVV